MKTHFQRAREMLDQMVPTLPGDGVAAVRQKLTALSGGYPTIWDSAADPIDYSDPATHAAYVFTYLPANGDLIYQTLCGARPQAKAILGRPETRIACMGGGPGSDFLGVVKFVERLASVRRKLSVKLLDYNASWWEVWDHTLATLPDNLDCTVEFRKMDYAAGENWCKNTDYLDSDLFIFSYSLSEVWRYNSARSVSKFLDFVIREAKTGSMFIYSDNSGGRFDPHFEREFVARDDLELVYRQSYDHMVVGNDEESSELAVYKKAFGREPKLKGNATCAALMKL